MESTEKTGNLDDEGLDLNNPNPLGEPCNASPLELCLVRVTKESGIVLKIERLDEDCEDLEVAEIR